METLLDKKISDLTVRELLKVLKESRKQKTERKTYTFKTITRGIDRYNFDEKLQKTINEIYEYDENGKMPAKLILDKVSKIYKTDPYRLGVQLNKMGYKGKLIRLGVTTCRAYNLKLK